MSNKSVTIDGKTVPLTIKPKDCDWYYGYPDTNVQITTLFWYCGELFGDCVFDDTVIEVRYEENHEGNYIPVSGSYFNKENNPREYDTIAFKAPQSDL